MNALKAIVDRLYRRGTALYLHNTMGNLVQRFEPMPGTKEVRMYNCGPTVYGRQHIGNLSMFVFTDLLRRVLLYNGFALKQVINITDFGHLSSDADEGEDKMSIGMQREGLAPTMENMKVLAERYTELFLEDLRALNVQVDGIEFPRASAYVPAQIAMIKTLEEKGYTYATPSGVYFDTTRFAAYGKLGNIDLAGLRAGARVESTDKKHPTDFILWKSSDGLGWDSPWGKGFPGWHIECSAMARSCLGQQIDIHTGGIEHIPVHHNNEIAQSECATGKHPFSRFWLHRAHLQLEGAKIAKSAGNVVYLSDIIERGFHPLAMRYLLLGAHYRTPSNFTWEALGAAQNAFAKLVALRLSIKDAPGVVPLHWHARFFAHINNDLDSPRALALMWEMTKDKDLSAPDLLAALLDFDRVFGLGLSEPDDHARRLASGTVEHEIPLSEIPEHIRAFINEREVARKAKNFPRADSLRALIEEAGFKVKDGDSPRVFKL